MTTMQLMTNILLIGGSFAAFSVLHSLIAGVGVRDRLAARLGRRMVRGVYRLVYNGIAVVTLAIPVILAAALPDAEMYRVMPPLSFGLIAIQVIGVVGAAVTLLQTDFLSFAGITQALTLLRGDEFSEAPSAPLQTGGLYRWMRHPLYVFSLMAIWALPVMTVNVLIFNVAATLYFWLGSIVEERRLERVYGDAYREYKRRVGWIGVKQG